MLRIIYNAIDLMTDVRTFCCVWQGGGHRLARFHLYSTTCSFEFVNLPNRMRLLHDLATYKQWSDEGKEKSENSAVRWYRYLTRTP